MLIQIHFYTHFKMIPPRITRKSRCSSYGIPAFCSLIGNYDEFPIKQKHFVQTMRTRTRRDSCFASVLGAGKKDVLLIILNA